ncbi:recombination protein RecR [Acinetobacter baumannii IS-123]|nr:recombination protein RecR [Acinetobacter baumannii IS-123]
MFSDRFEQLVQALRILPSVGPKSAQRMALHLLMKNREGAFALAHALHEASSYIHECSVCHSLTEHEICDICASTERDDQLLCVVESPGLWQSSKVVVFVANTMCWVDTFLH